MAIDYSKSIMEIVEKHLSPTPTYLEKRKCFGAVGLVCDGETERAMDEVKDSVCGVIKNEYAGGLMRKAGYIKRTRKRRKG